MLQKKPSPFLLDPSRKKLESLYAHRKAIDTLIQSLEQYDKYRAKAIVLEKQKSA